MHRLIKFVLILFTGLFVLTVLVLALFAGLIGIFWSLLTGRKPTLLTVSSRFRQASEHFRRDAWAGGTATRNAGSADIVDVQAHEVRDALQGPSDAPGKK